MVPIVIHPGNYPSGYQWCEACELALTRPRTTQALQKAQGELTVLRLPDNSDNSKPSKRPHSAHVAVSWACAGEKLERSWLHVSSSLNCGKMAALEQLLQTWHDERDSKVRLCALPCEVAIARDHPTACADISCSARESSCRTLCLNDTLRTVRNCSACRWITHGTTMPS